MRKYVVLPIVAAAFGAGCHPAADRFDPQEIIALERGALDRWGKGDPGGFFDIMAAEQTYFDPMTDKRIDGQEALKKYIAPFTGKISIERVEMIDPKVQRGWGSHCPDVQSERLWRAGRGRAQDHGAVELDRGVSTDQRILEDRTLALVVRETRHQRD